MLNHAIAESDLQWWHCYRAGELGLSAQAYDFDEPHHDHISSDHAMCAALWSPQRIRSVTRWYELAPRVREFTERYPCEARIARGAYEPHGWPLLLRIGLSLAGARHAVCLIGIAGLSTRALAARDKKRPSEGIVEFLQWEATQRNDSLIRGVREELHTVLDNALECYECVRSVHVGKAQAEHEAWYQGITGAL